MTKKRESELRERIVNALRSRGARVVVVHQDGYHAGEPDLDVVFRGRSVKLEVKTPESDAGASPLQKAAILDIRGHGGVAAVVRSIEEAIRCLEIAGSNSATRGVWKWYENEGAGR